MASTGWNVVAKVSGPRDWTNTHVVWTLLRAARSVRSREQILLYFGSRSKRVPESLKRRGHREFKIDLASLAAPLGLSADSGGLAIYYEIMTQRVYAPDSSWFPQPGDTVVDVGANIGVFTLWAAAEADARVIAIEPNPVAFAQLEGNVATLPNVTTHSLGCGNEPGSLTLRYPPGRLSISSFEERADRSESVQVEVRALDDVLGAEVEIIHLLKIDVEGFELQVLKGARTTLERTRRIALEIAGSDLGPCHELLVAAGFVNVGTRSGMWNLPARRGIIAYFERQGRA